MKRYLFLLLAVVFYLPIEAKRPGDPANISTADHWTNQMLQSGTYMSRAKHMSRPKHLGHTITVAVQKKVTSKHATEVTVDEATGITTITWGDGAMYRGQTYYGEIKGVGTMVYPDGSKYCGQWERDLPNGYGTMLYPDGLAYSANFVNGLPHGKGVVEDADGNKFSARWVYGKLKEKSLKPYKEKK